MPSFEQEFLGPFRAKVEEEVIGTSIFAVRVTTEEIYREIFRQWPADTFWSMANHRINQGRNPSGDFPVVPAERPEGRGALLDRQFANMQSQLSKLNVLNFGASTRIGNAVPYAADVGLDEDGNPKVGNGIRIYQEAAASGSAAAESLIRGGVKKVRPSELSAR